MSEYTTNLNLFKYTNDDYNQVFDFQMALNDNWNKIDSSVALTTHTHSGYVSTSSLSEVTCVVETYVNGDSWYRIWSDGWCEQGGLLIPTSVNNDTVTLTQTYRDMGYHVLFGNMYKNAVATATSCLYAASKTPNSFIVYNSTDTAFYTYWYTYGYLY